MNSSQSSNYLNQSDHRLSEFVRWVFLRSNQKHPPSANSLPHKEDIYKFFLSHGIQPEILARYMAEFLSMEFISFINPEMVKEHVLPERFCKMNSVVCIQREGRFCFVCSNPFNRELIDMIHLTIKDVEFSLAVADPQTLNFLLVESEDVYLSIAKPADALDEQGEAIGSVVVKAANNLLRAAVQSRASDIHIEPKETYVLVRFRIDGEMKDVYALKPETGARIISRFKLFGGLDITDKRKPQDGIIEAQVVNKKFKLRLATTSTPVGESIIIRLLDQSKEIPKLSYLGLSEHQEQLLVNLAGRNRGMILIVGTTGSGKTTTIYSLLSTIDFTRRSLISVEDPIEYRIPFCNQQQVNEKAKISFDSILKSSVRQDPDVLFIGEIRDAQSAKIAMDFASTGHLTITSMHTSNATTAIFRLERVEISRSVIADSVAAIVAQRLLKKLCVHCKEIGPPNEKEREMLKAFIETMPEQVARPKGCPKCAKTGFHGREGVCEILEISPEMQMLVRSGKSIAEIRNFAQRHGAFLIHHHAIEKMKNFIFSPEEIYERILIEEPKDFQAEVEQASVPVSKTAPKVDLSTKEKPEILLVEDDKEHRDLMLHLLESHGYDITVAEDGIGAILCLGKKKYDLILSDVNMPNLDGIRMIEVVRQKGIDAPIVLMTAHPLEGIEKKCFELGAADFLIKPVKKEVLLLRLERIIRDYRRNQ